VEASLRVRQPITEGQQVRVVGWWDGGVVLAQASEEVAVQVTAGGGKGQREDGAQEPRDGATHDE
jgi:hypothetical protein